MSWTWPEFDSIEGILGWLRSRSGRYGIHDVGAVLAFAQGYSLARRLQYLEFAGALRDSSQAFFEMDSPLLPTFAVRRHSPSPICDVSIFYAWLDWRSNASVHAIAATELSADIRARFDNKQQRFYRGYEDEIVPSPRRILIVDDIDGALRVLMLDDDERVFYEVPAKSLYYAKSAAHHFADCEFDWVAVDMSFRCGTLGRLSALGSSEQAAPG